MMETTLQKHWIVKAPDAPLALVPKENREFVSERQAYAVAEKLAASNPGQRFVVYEALGVLVTGGVSRTYL